MVIMSEECSLCLKNVIMVFLYTFTDKLIVMQVMQCFMSM